MMQPIEMLERIAEILAQVPDKIVFTGGATIALYLEEVAVPDIRPTDDVDCVVEITSRGKYYQLLGRSCASFFIICCQKCWSWGNDSGIIS